MSKPKSGPQDLPPKGGYPPFQIDRIKLRRLIAGRLGLGILVASNVIGFPMYYKAWLKRRKEKIEYTSMQLATFPILCAERDRLLLRHLKKLRAFETEVMKDFPHWEVGTLLGVPIYESMPVDTYIEPSTAEFYIGADPADPPYLFYCPYVP